VRDRDAVRRALDGVDAGLPLRAAVGVGQSMYEIAQYTDINNMGTAVLLEALVERAKTAPLSRLVVASSMSLYGEGLYRAPDGTIVTQAERTRDQLVAADWEPRDASGQVLEPLPTPETKPPSLASVYALSKYDQERLCLMVGRAYAIPTVAMRFFNVFGTRQALSNPYTGVLAIFAARYLNDRAPMIFEDGDQQRDFVSVYDVRAACRARSRARGAGRGVQRRQRARYTIREIAERMAGALGKGYLAPEVSGKYRVGDIRHCVADVTKAQRILGYAPEVTLEDGVVELAEWLEGQTAFDRVAEASAELAARGLTV
jgi:dTDP-L-rhamnose 4-epimerase